MPTPQDLKRLGALLARLTAIGQVQRGGLIRADDWNALVAAVGDVAQAVLAAEAAPVVPSHEHRDQVTSAWLAPPLRELLERGPLADPATQARLLEIEQRLRRLADLVEDGGKRVEEFRGRITDVASRDLEREAALTKVRRSLDGVIDPRPDLLAVRTSLASVQKDLGSVLEAAARLTVNGQVVDIGAVIERVTGLEQLRERLRFANGELLDAATVERRLAEVTASSVSHEELDEVLAQRPVQVPPDVVAGLEQRLGTQLRDQLTASNDNFGRQLRDEMNGRFQTVGALVDTRVADAIPGISQTITAQVTVTIDEARRQAIAAAIAEAAQNLQTGTQALRDELTALVGAVTAGIPPAVEAALDRQLPGQLAGLRADLEATVKRLDAVAQQSGRHEELIAQLATAVARLPQDQIALRAELRQMIAAEIDVRDTANRRATDQRLAAFEREMLDRLANASREAQNAAVGAANRVAVESAQAEARGLRGQLLAEMRAVAREEIRATGRDQLVKAVDDALAAQLPSLVAAEVRRVTPVVRPGSPLDRP
jgi:hypothetical protein